MTLYKLLKTATKGTIFHSLRRLLRDDTKRQDSVCEDSPECSYQYTLNQCKTIPTLRPKLANYEFQLNYAATTLKWTQSDPRQTADQQEPKHISITNITINPTDVWNNGKRMRERLQNDKNHIWLLKRYQPKDRPHHSYKPRCHLNSQTKSSWRKTAMSRTAISRSLMCNHLERKNDALICCSSTCIGDISLQKINPSLF